MHDVGEMDQSMPAVPFAALDDLDEGSGCAVGECAHHNPQSVRVITNGARLPELFDDPPLKRVVHRRDGTVARNRYKSAAVASHPRLIEAPTCCAPRVRDASVSSTISVMPPAARGYLVRW